MMFFVHHIQRSSKQISKRRVKNCRTQCIPQQMHLRRKSNHLIVQIGYGYGQFFRGVFNLQEQKATAVQPVINNATTTETS